MTSSECDDISDTVNENLNIDSSTTNIVTNSMELDILNSSNTCTIYLDYPYQLEACYVDDEIVNLESLFEGEGQLLDQIIEESSEVAIIIKSEESSTLNSRDSVNTPNNVGEAKGNTEITALLSELRQKYTQHSNMECFPHNPTRRGNEQFIEFEEEPEDTRVGNTNWIRRKTAYRFFTTWVHGYLGVGNRKPIPSCAVYLIQNTFPDPEDHYMGFKESSNYPAEFLALE
ncbi:uncharacterized protein LOC122920065 [Bufo gargarizans]|uniref:uncharacterized protein LOC122920065 n=1 Tax=Bufo gargarizans TaxID=30331 RepID=UPI001CF57E79|nr:uncharacterized protein LOC122920065 [Bufo gargarizans]